MARRPALATAAAAALLLGAAGCKPSSLTPFGIETRGPDSSVTGVNGSWQGTTSAGGSVSFQVGDDNVTTLVMREQSSGCSREFKTEDPVPIEDDAFTLEVRDGNDRFILNGRFTSQTVCSGSYRFEVHSTVGSCPNAGAGSFVAAKAP